ncbi:hypothetical protein D3C87_1757780 [compost metagenome]
MDRDTRRVGSYQRAGLAERVHLFVKASFNIQPFNHYLYYPIVIFDIGQVIVEIAEFDPRGECRAV